MAKPIRIIQNTQPGSFIGNFSVNLISPGNRPVCIPSTNIYESETKIILELFVPGYGNENLSVSLVKNKLEITGTVHTQLINAKKIFSEFRIAAFNRVFILPPSFSDKPFTTSYIDGILTVEIDNLCA